MVRKGMGYHGGPWEPEKDFYHEDHEDHEESTGFKNVFVLFVSFVVSISLHLELLHANTARHEDCRVGGASSQ